MTVTNMCSHLGKLGVGAESMENVTYSNVSESRSQTCMGVPFESVELGTIWAWPINIALLSTANL